MLGTEGLGLQYVVLPHHPAVSLVGHHQHRQRRCGEIAKVDPGTELKRPAATLLKQNKPRLGREHHQIIFAGSYLGFEASYTRQMTSQPVWAEESPSEAVNTSASMRTRCFCWPYTTTLLTMLRGRSPAGRSAVSSRLRPKNRWQNVVLPASRGPTYSDKSVQFQPYPSHRIGVNKIGAYNLQLLYCFHKRQRNILLTTRQE